MHSRHNHQVFEQHVQSIGHSFLYYLYMFLRIHLHLVLHVLENVVLEAVGHVREQTNEHELERRRRPRRPDLHEQVVVAAVERRSRHRLDRVDHAAAGWGCG